MAVRWGFLEGESEPCAVVSERMELVYLNRPGRALGAVDWFGKRCFEVLPVTDAWCALHCQTIKTVSQTDEIAYCEESVRGEEGTEIALGGAIIPLAPSEEDGARALIVLRRKDRTGNEAGFRERLLADARALRTRVASHFG